MTAAIALSFQFETFVIRTLMIDDQPWFGASDICKVLGYKDVHNSIGEICRAEGVSVRDPIINGSRQVLAFINETNLYRLMFRCNRKNAIRFETWLSNEALPALLPTEGRQKEDIENGPTRRYLISFTCQGEQQVIEVPRDAFVMSYREIINQIATSKETLVSTDEMLELAMAALTYLKARSGYRNNHLH